MLEHPHGPGALSQDLSHAVGIEPGDDAQQDHLRLITWEPGQVCKRGVEREAPCEFAVDLGCVKLEHLRRDGIRAPPCFAPARIDHPPPADRERPSEEGVAIARESTEATGDLEPDVRREILGTRSREPRPADSAEAADGRPARQRRQPTPHRDEQRPRCRRRWFPSDRSRRTPPTHRRGSIERESSGRQSVHQPCAISTSVGSSPAPNARYSTPSGPASTSRMVSLSMRIASHWPSSTISSSTLILAEPLVTT